ncbi:phage tail protein [Bacillus sp. FSL W8-0223]|uniref:phage tail protein n=1 Tax=Bacillus sp. FSL W8-0223 TaxID=2954595 RepID=UPI0030F5717F
MRTYTTVLGDTFDKIALEQLGNEYLFPLLLRANPKYRNVIIFSAGVTLVIPDLPDNLIDQNLPDWLETTDEEEETSTDEITVLDGVDA